ncbi:hypothetical protein [Blastochloris viridis]|uniref:Uncharacterized protein n=1 Tax=Blastochloris viridis TaxID=1079 RepID=A0A0H5BHG3_BLAVI|nr:hypothetical protein [Blastochloris viridis]ALK10221.1 hypothetical protein BVIR_2454 [Blastochloris viridis]BAR99846.1 hypothetical protein BV133_2253 [Blastochloris viridis]CUU42885.1 hypothetical protein BVIRIDIS_19000 [Blastochloris viridis]
MTRPIVVAVVVYLAAVAALIGASAEQVRLLDPVPWYQMTMFWLAPETSFTRIGALVAAGRDADGLLYAAVVGISLGLLGGLALFGVSLALSSPARTRLLPQREALLFICLLVALVLTADPIISLARNLEQRGLMEPAGLNAMPGYWIATVVVTCGLFARYATLMAHDATAWSRTAWRRLRHSRPSAAHRHLPPR